jgi:hypothetical protein
MTELQRATYETRYGVQFVVGQLGDGKDGVVLMHRMSTAVKFFHNSENYTRELRAYRALRHARTDQVLGLHVPQFIRSDDELLAIEITVVTPPFLLDFASAYSDDELNWLGFTPEVWGEREAHWAEVFGDRWPDAAAVRVAFHRITGLHLLDLSPNNIRLA